MDPWHVWFFTVSCVEWVCVVVRVRLREAAQVRLEIEPWPQIESWWATASTSFVDYRIEV